MKWQIYRLFIHIKIFFYEQAYKFCVFSGQCQERRAFCLNEIVWNFCCAESNSQGPRSTSIRLWMDLQLEKLGAHFRSPEKFPTSLILSRLKAYVDCYQWANVIVLERWHTTSLLHIMKLCNAKVKVWWMGAEVPVLVIIYIRHEFMNFTVYFR